MTTEKQSVLALPGGSLTGNSLKTVPIATPTPGVHLTINVQVQCDAGELGDLGTRLRKVIDDFNTMEPPPHNGDPQQGGM